MMARAGLTAERITRAAADLADEIGFDNVTMSALAKKFGVKDASLYSHVKNLRELRARVSMLAAAEKTALIADAVAGRAGRDALAAFADAWRGYARRYPGRYTATQTPVAPGVVEVDPAAARGVELTYGMLRAYGLTEPDLTDAVRLLRSTFHGYAALEASGGFAHSRDTDSSWERIIDALHVTLEQWPTRDKEQQ
ncbi:TetR family transcriptional regulator [Nocardia tenerifensis]|uniref:TetR family transcriptional regulator n=1 Tax=Nocardia tenerifensis TaxID=228006 RepID=A0A318KDI7_9NOCA|nr:TetR-like C-terminal domain-containing protein [Nocardia tenerifensis]PXX70829.1 TetR family transcriptional regulator [Nocardia tenerifensis]